LDTAFGDNSDGMEYSICGIFSVINDAIMRDIIALWLYSGASLVSRHCCILVRMTIVS